MEVSYVASSKTLLENSKLDFFHYKETDMSHMSDVYVKVDANSSSNLTNGFILFDFAHNHFIDFSDSFMRFVVNIRRKDGTALSDAENIAPENFFFTLCLKISTLL